MELTSDFVQAAQDIVLQPNLTSAIVLFTSSLVNELFSLLPYNIIVSGQLFFLKEPISIVMFIKLSSFVVIPVGIGATIGSLPMYGVSYFGGKPTIEKFGKYVRLSWGSVERLISKFKGGWYDEILFLCLRSIPFLPSLPINVAAGILRLHPAPYLVLTLAGNVIKMMIMLLFVGFSVNGVESLVQ